MIINNIINKFMVIGICGVRGSGKDFMALKLKEQLEKEGKKVVIYGFSQGVRDITFRALGVEINTPGEYDIFKVSTYKCVNVVRTGREWLEYYGEGIRSTHPTFWSDYWLSNVCKSADIIIASDCRFPHEAMSVKMLATTLNREYNFYFADYHSKRYDDADCDTNKLALNLRKYCTHNQDITDYFTLNTKNSYTKNC